MEQAEIFHIVAIVSFAVSGLCLLLAAVSWFKLGIPEVRYHRQNRKETDRRI